MSIVILSRETNQVTGVNRKPFPFEYTVQIDSLLNITKIDEAIQGKRQKTKDDIPLYMDNIVFNELGEVISFDEVAYSQKPINYIQKEVASNRKNEMEEFVEIVDISTNSQNLEPVLEDNIVNILYDFSKDFTKFNYEDVLKAKINQINDNSHSNLVVYDQDLNVENFSINLASHKADMGAGFISIHPLGQIRTNKISLSEETSRIELYIEKDQNIKVEIGITASNFIECSSNVVLLNSPTSEVYLRFTNKIDKHQNLYAYGILI